MVPEFYLFMLPFLKSLSDGKIHSSDECVEYVCKEMNLSEADRKEPTKNSKRTKVVDRTLWSKTYLQWAGLVNTVNRGHYCITSEGSALLGKGLTIITRDYLVKNYKCFLENSQREKKPKDNKVKSVAEHEDVIYAIQSPNDRIPVEDQVKSLVLSASPSGIKSIVSNLLITLGYYFDGQDLTIEKEAISGCVFVDKLCIVPVFVYIALGTTDVSRNDIGKVLPLMYDKSCNCALFISLGSLSEEAKRFSATSYNIREIDVDELVRILIENKIGMKQISRDIVNLSFFK